MLVFNRSVRSWVPEFPLCCSTDNLLTAEYAPQSKLRAALLLKDELLKNAISSYLGTASDFTEADFTLVFSPAITTPKHEERPSKFIGERHRFAK